MKLKLGELNARMLCQYTAVAEVASQVFGEGKGETKKEEFNDLAAAPTFEAALANINKALTVG